MRETAGYADVGNIIMEVGNRKGLSLASEKTIGEEWRFRLCTGQERKTKGFESWPRAIVQELKSEFW